MRRTICMPLPGLSDACGFRRQWACNARRVIAAGLQLENKCLPGGDGTPPLSVIANGPSVKGKQLASLRYQST